MFCLGTKKRLDSIVAAVPSTHDDDAKDEDCDGDDVHDVLLKDIMTTIIITLS